MRRIPPDFASVLVPIGILDGPVVNGSSSDHSLDDPPVGVCLSVFLAFFGVGFEEIDTGVIADLVLDLSADAGGAFFDFGLDYKVFG